MLPVCVCFFFFSFYNKFAIFYFVCFKSMDLWCLHFRHFVFSNFTFWSDMVVTCVFFTANAISMLIFFFFLEEYSFFYFFTSYFLYSGSIFFLTIDFKHSVFIEWFDWTSNPKSLFEGLPFIDFLVDSSVCFLVDLLLYFCTLPNSS